ncbi:MAG: hypothetical protein JRJ85_06680 [Deltaproteobacteria bacterium]|nr:hypothetical protein [Deltaproteobacteria bacterium]
MSYIPDESKVVYQSKDGKKEKVSDALEWPRRRRRDASTRGAVVPMVTMAAVSIWPRRSA